jgi:hypothetical protein
MLFAAVWSLVFAGIYHAVRRDLATARVLALVVFSHWVLDWITHRPDLPLIPGSSFRTGLGLWRSVAGTVAIECAMFLAAVWWYARSTEPLDKVGRWALVAYVTLLLILYGAGLGPPPQPGQERMVAIVSLSGVLFLAWAAWIDRHRVQK